MNEFAESRGKSEREREGEKEGGGENGGKCFHDSTRLHRFVANVDSSCGNKGYRFPPPIVNYRAPFATATAIEIPNEISNFEREQFNNRADE